jgi:hypothetical protein
MNRLLLLLVLIGTGQGISAQYVYTIKADSTVTLRAYNASSSAVTIASDTYKVRVIK